MQNAYGGVLLKRVRTLDIILTKTSLLDVNSTCLWRVEVKFTTMKAKGNMIQTIIVMLTLAPIK